MESQAMKGVPSGVVNWMPGKDVENP